MNATPRQRAVRRAAAGGLGLLLALGVLLHAAYYADDGMMDDAFITFRYAERWATTGELAYNAGEPTEGYSNPAWTAMLAGAAWLGVPPVMSARAFGVGCALLAAAMTWRAWEGEARRARMSAAATMAGRAALALGWASSSMVAYWASSGMETMQFACVLFAAAWWAWRAPVGGGWGAGATGAALVLALLLSRPEAFGYLPCVAIAAAWRWGALDGRGRRALAWGGVVAIVLFGAYLAWRRATYGAWLPLTVAAKELPFDWAWRAGASYLRVWLLVTAPAAAWAILFGGVAVAAAWALVRAPRRAGLFVVGGSVVAANGAFIVLSGGDWMPNGRFVAHVAPWWFLLMAATAARAVEFLRSGVGVDGGVGVKGAAASPARRIAGAAAVAGWAAAGLVVAFGSARIDTSMWHNFVRYFWHRDKFGELRLLDGAARAGRDAAANLVTGRVVGVRAFAHVHPAGPRRHGGPNGGGCLAPEMLLAIAPGARLLMSDIGMPGTVLDDVIIEDAYGLVTPIHAAYHQGRLAGPAAEQEARRRLFGNLDAAPPEWVYLYERHDGLAGTPGEGVVRSWMDERGGYVLVHVHRHWYWPEPTWTMELWRREDVVPPAPAFLRPRMERLERLFGARHDAGATLALWREALLADGPPAWPASFDVSLYGDPAMRTIRPAMLDPARLRAEAAAR